MSKIYCVSKLPTFINEVGSGRAELANLECIMSDWQSHLEVDPWRSQVLTLFESLVL